MHISASLRWWARSALIAGLLFGALSPAMAQQAPDDPPIGFNQVALPDLLPLGYPFPEMLSATPEGVVLMRGTNDQAGGASFDAYLLVSDGNVRELFRSGEELLDVDGVSLGFLQRASAQFLGDGSIVLSARLRPTLGSSQINQRLLRLEIETGLRELPISADGVSFDLAQDPGSGTVPGTQASVSQSFVVRRVFPSRFFVTDGDTLLRELETFGRQSSSLPESFRAVVHAHSDLVLLEVNEYTAVAQDASGFVTHERIDWRYEIDGPGDAIRIVASGQYEREFTPSAFGTPVVTATRGIAPATAAVGGNDSGGGAYINSSGQVIIGLRSPAAPGQNFFPNFNPPSWQRVDPDGTVTTLIAADTFSFLSVHGILESGGLLARASSIAGATPSRIFFPDRTQVLITDGDPIGDIACQFATTPAVAGPNVLLRCFLEAPQGHIRNALAIPGDSPVLRWTAEFGGEWGDPENWDPARVPGQGDETLFDLDGGYEVVVGQRQSGRSRVEEGAVTFRESDLELLGQLSVGGESVLRLPGGALRAPEVVIGHLPPLVLDTPRGAALRMETGAVLDVSGRVTIGDADEGFLLFEAATPVIQEVLVGGLAEGRLSIVGRAQEDGIITSLRVGVDSPGSVALVDGARLAGGSVEIGAGAPAEVEMFSTSETGSPPLTLWEFGGGGDFTINDNGRLVVGTASRLRTDVFQMGVRAPGDPEAAPARASVSGNAFDEENSDRPEIGGRAVRLGVASGSRAELRASAGGFVQVGGAATVGSGEVEFRMAVGQDTSVLLEVRGEDASGRASSVVVTEPDNLDDPLLSPLITCRIGERGRGRLVVREGGEFICDGSLIAGDQASGRGDIVVSGGGVDSVSVLSTGLLCLGRADECAGDDPGGVGTLTLADDGQVITLATVVAASSLIRGNGFISADRTRIEGTVEPGIGFEASEPPTTSPEMALPPMSRMVMGRSTHDSLGSVHPGVLSFDSDVTFAAGSTLLLDIEGPLPEHQDRLIVTGVLTIEDGARMIVTFGNGYAPQQGDAFELLPQGTGVTGSFEVEVSGLEPGFEFTLDTTEGGLQLLALNDGISVGGGGGGGGGEPGEEVFTTAAGQQVTCIDVECVGRARGDGGADPGADLVVDAAGLVVAENIPVVSADISVLLHVGSDSAPSAAQQFLSSFDTDGTLLFETRALIELPGTQTRIARNADGLPFVITTGQSAAGLSYSIEGRADGFATNEVRDAGEVLVARITSRIAGADTVVAEDGTLQVQVELQVEDGTARRAVVEMRPDGILVTRFEHFDDGQWLLLQRTLDVINDFAPGSEVLIEQGEDGARFVIDSQVAEALVF
jgi:hypothetical protein